MNYKEELAEFVKSVENSSLTQNLKSILLYGNPVRIKDYKEAQFNLFFTFEKVEIDTLEQLSKLIQQHNSIQIEPFILTEKEIESSSDCYPIKFLDISQNHELLFGIDPFDKIQVCQDNLRLRCEQELRNISLRLRYRFVKSNLDLNTIRREVRKSLYPLMNNLEVVIILKTKKVITDYDELIAKAKSDLNIDSNIIKELISWSKNETRIKDDEFLEKHEEYRAFLNQLITLIDLH